MIIIGWIALFFMVFEVTQLVFAQRFIGIVQIRQNLHPLDAPAPISFGYCIAWVVCLLLDYAFQAGLLLAPMNHALVDRPYYIRLAGILMLIISAIGFALRRACGVKWGLVVLTMEGSSRAGFFAFVFGYIVVMHGIWWHYQYYQ